MARGQQSALHWENSIDSARQSAARSNRLVLAIFTAPSWCMACRALENDLITQPGAAGLIEANYVPVKINVDLSPELKQQYGVQHLPTTFVLAAGGQGEVLDKIEGRPRIDQYLARLNQVAADQRRRNTAVYAQITPAPAVSQNRSMTPPVAVAMATAPAAKRQAGASPTAPIAPNPPATVAPAVSDTSTAANTSAIRPAVRTAIQPPSGYPPFGLDGYCPVQLSDKQAWNKGDRKWGAVHRGRTYLFAGLEERRRFMNDPDHYAPVNSGNDVVAAVEQNRVVPGRRAYGLQYAGHVYLFADERSMEKFQSHPRDYAERALQAQSNGAPLGTTTR